MTGVSFKVFVEVLCRGDLFCFDVGVGWTRVVPVVRRLQRVLAAPFALSFFFGDDAGIKQPGAAPRPVGDNNFECSGHGVLALLYEFVVNCGCGAKVW